MVQSKKEYNYTSLKFPLKRSILFHTYQIPMALGIDGTIS